MSPRARIVGGVVLMSVVATLAVVSDREALALAVVPVLAREGLADLDAVAGLRDATGASAVAQPVGVVVEVDGPAWVAAAIEDAVANDDVYAVRSGPHRIRGELVVTPPIVAMRVSLERRGWVLHGAAVRRRLLPALAVVPALVGVAAWAWSRRGALALVLAGVLAQVLLVVWPWPAELAAPRWADDVATGPLGALVVRLARGMDDTAFALAAGVVALTAVLALFDHRRSRSEGRVVLVSGLVALVGGLVWLEAAGRASVGAWITTPSGMVALVSSLALVVLVRVHHRKGGVPVQVGP